MCKGEYLPQRTNRTISILGIGSLELKDLKVYVCNRCGKEIFPEETISKVKQAQYEYASSPKNQLNPIFQ